MGHAGISLDITVDHLRHVRGLPSDIHPSDMREDCPPQRHQRKASGLGPTGELLSNFDGRALTYDRKLATALMKDLAGHYGICKTGEHFHIEADRATSYAARRHAVDIFK
eukprot:scaffold195110_cov18-Prasinocladus_malaysianus.AAC.1